MNIARMQEVELTSELLIAGSAGMQDKKASVDGFYEKGEEVYPTQKRDESRFQTVLSTTSETFADSDLAGSEFRRPPLFYTLYCAVYHHLYELPDVLRQSPKKWLSSGRVRAKRITSRQGKSGLTAFTAKPSHSHAQANAEVGSRF